MSKEKTFEDLNGKYIFSLSDFRNALEETNGDILNLGCEMVDVLSEKITEYLKRYTNVDRFYDRNCCGCVACKKECDFTYGKGKAEGCWEKAMKGELFDCPVRVNGTIGFSPKEGMEQIDLSDRREKPYPVIKIED